MYYAAVCNVSVVSFSALVIIYFGIAIGFRLFE